MQWLERRGQRTAATPSTRSPRRGPHSSGAQRAAGNVHGRGFRSGTARVVRDLGGGVRRPERLQVVLPVVSRPPVRDAAEETRGERKPDREAVARSFLLAFGRPAGEQRGLVLASARVL